MIKFRVIGLFLILVITFSPCAFAFNSEVMPHDSIMGQSKTVVYVSDIIGDDNNSGLSPKKPKKTIRNAILATPDGGVVKIAKGVYNGEKNRDLRPDKNIEINFNQIIGNTAKDTPGFYSIGGSTDILHN